jgi:prepilin-type N-terminal cleavage/methylation domain-containing protein
MIKTKPFKRTTSDKTHIVDIAGFTLIETLIVIVIISVLAAIVAPSWVTFLNRQRANAGKDQVLQALRTAQANSKRLRQPVGISFNIPANQETDLPTITIRRDTQTLGEGSLKPGMASLSVVDGNGNNLTEIAFADDGSLTGTPTFDATGNVTAVDQNPPPTPVKVVVSSPAVNNPTRRCVIVQTLLGATRPGADAECN